MDMLSGQALQEAALEDWRKLAQALHGSFRVDSFADALTFVSAIGEICADAWREPDVRVTASSVDVQLVTPDATFRREDGSVITGPSATQLDVDLARRISEVARSLGLKPQPAAVVQLEVALDTADEAEIGPFWAAVLTGDSFRGGDVMDPTGRVPSLWFQATDQHKAPRQRFHFDLWLPPELVPARIEAAVAAGGTVVSDDEAPAFTVLADPQGNKVCLCTYLDRG